MRLSVAVLLLCLALAAHGAGLPLARFETPADLPSELAPLLKKVHAGADGAAAADAADAADAAEGAEGADAEDDERALRRLRESTLDVLATEGYFAPQVVVEADPTAQARHVIRVDPGRRARIASVDLRFGGAIARDAARVAQLQSGWALGVDAPFRNEAWSAAKTRLLGLVRERDFAAAAITDSSAEVDADAATVRLAVDIDSGPAFTLGRLEIKGLKRYTPELVERYNPFAQGDRYDAARLLEFQRQLQQSQYFGSVIVEVDASGSPQDAPIRVDVTEAQTKRAALGVGYSTDTGARVEATYRQSLLFDRPYTLSTGASIDRARQVAFADILLPRRPDGYLDSTGVLRENTDIEGVITSRWAFGVKRASSRQSGSVNYDTRLTISLESETRAFAGAPDLTQTNDVLATTYTWTRRAVDSVTNPTRGDLLTLSGTLGLQRGSLGELLQQSFVRLYGRYVYWLPLSPKDQLTLRAEAGHVQVDDPKYVPSDYLFRTGGTNTVRGYAFESLGADVGDAVTGSKELLVGSVEYVRWIDPVWGAAVFVDAGDAAYDLRRLGLARGYGIGARYRTVAGPIAFDVAYGERYQEWRVHFAIAIAF